MQFEHSTPCSYNAPTFPQSNVFPPHQKQLFLPFPMPSPTSSISSHPQNLPPQPSPPAPFPPYPPPPFIDDLPLLQHILSNAPPPPIATPISPESPSSQSEQDLHHHLTSMAILKAEHLPSHLHHLRRLALVDGTALHLQVSPPASVSLLRHERLELETEAQTLRLLRHAGLPVPTVIRHDASDTLLGAPFLLTTALNGLSLGKVLSRAGRTERRVLERQIDSFAERVDALKGERFGPVVQVTRGEGFADWADAFTWMVCEVLRDGEDVFVNLPYSGVREVLGLEGVRTALDGIREARLCVQGFGGAKGVFVERGRVVGLAGFKNAWWGDDGLAEEDAEEIEDERTEEEAIRGLLYASYHSLVTIVKSYYRPGREHLELDARRKLTTCLARLNNLA